jgi:hypothetical protein
MHIRTILGNPMSMSLKAWITTAALVVGIAVGIPAPAAASESQYLQLKDNLTYLTTGQLLTEGYRVCGAIDNGVRSTDTVSMVMNDLGVSVDAALDIVAAASDDLGC